MKKYTLKWIKSDIEKTSTYVDEIETDNIEKYIKDNFTCGQVVYFFEHQ